MDQQFDVWTAWLQTKIITYSLVSWHWITHFWGTISECTSRTVKAIRNAHTPENWYFRARNECPWPMKHNQLTIGHFSTEAMWSPEIPRMYFNENCRGELTVHSFDDVVIAELYNADKIIHYDMSSFFHNFSWRSVRAAPSLYEVVLLYCLTNNIFFSKSQLSGFTLEVLTAEGETIKQRLDSTRSYAFFEGWESYNETEGADDDSNSVDSE